MRAYRFVAAVAAFLVFAYSAGAAELAAQRNAQRGVTVEVTPQNLAAGTPAWEFKVVLDTHSGELRDDLVKTAVLVDSTGTRYAPLTWEGAAPGGHHREGILRFAAIDPLPPSIELRIERAGEAAPRIFRWKLQ